MPVPPNMIRNDDLLRPEAAAGQLLVRVRAAGVGRWDALVREVKSGLHQPLPLILGSELSGIVEAIGANVSGFKTGDEVYAAANEQFTGACAEYALPSARRMAQKPKILNFVEAASKHREISGDHSVVSRLRLWIGSEYSVMQEHWEQLAVATGTCRYSSSRGTNLRATMASTTQSFAFVCSGLTYNVPGSLPQFPGE